MRNAPPRSWGATYGPVVAVVAAMAVTLALSLSLGITRSQAPLPGNTYDYIVVGLGAAGTIVTNVLSVDGTRNVLGLEAGPNQDNNPLVTQVTNAALLYGAPATGQLFWGQFKGQPSSEPNPPLTVGNWPYTGGRCLGGSTSINTLQYVQGTDWMCQKWVNLTGGDQRWNVTNAIADWIALTTFMGTTNVPQNRGTNGSLNVLQEFTTGNQTTVPAMATKFVAAMTALTGLAQLPDYNGMTPSSEVGPFTAWQLMAFPNGTRCSASHAFLPPWVRARTNLGVSLSSQTTKILMSGTTAIGVQYLQNGVPTVSYARKEVIISAGINSAQLLQNSGIGPGGSVIDNPAVGAQLYNHQGVIAIWSTNASDGPSENPNDLFMAGAWLPTVLNSSVDATGLSPRRFVMITEAQTVPSLGPIMVAILFNLQPNQTGYVHPFDSDPLRMPNVTDNVFLAPDGTVDLLGMTLAVKKYICDLAPIYASSIDPSYTLISPSSAQCANLTLLQEFVTSETDQSAHHWTSSNAMGVCGDGVAVVDSRGRVCGTKNLRVADASIIPRPFDGNTEGPSLRVGWVVGNDILSGG